jgi:hypothetical protein
MKYESNRKEGKSCLIDARSAINGKYFQYGMTFAKMIQETQNTPVTKQITDNK